MSPSPPLLSIVIVAYKSRDEISGCLTSLPQAVGEHGVEVIVVDNSPGDGDGSGEIVQRDFPWVKYVAAPTNLGFGRANNLGYSLTDPISEFVLFLNPDTVCNETAIVHCIDRLRADQTIGLISPKLVLADGSMDLACRRSIPTLWDGFCRASGLAAAFPNVAVFSGYNLTHLPETGAYDVGAINGAFMFARRSVLDAIATSRTRVEDEGLKFKAGGIAKSEGQRAESLELRAESLGQRAESEGRRAEGGEPVEGLTVERSEGASPSTVHRLPSTGPALPSEHGQTDRATAEIFDERFFMYGDDLDLCIRIARAGWRIVYDGTVSITHLKGVSVAKDYGAMSQAIFDANRDVYLKHFNPDGSAFVRWKYQVAFGVWKRVARLRAAGRKQRRVRPL